MEKQSTVHAKDTKSKKTIIERLKGMGPAAIITSAFIGPGTVTTSTLAGVNYGYALLWAVLFSVISLIVLMEMSSRIGIISQLNAIDAAIETVPGNNIWKRFIQVLVFFAVASISFAFQAGNIIGASLGLGDLTGLSVPIAALIIGALAMLTAVGGSYKILERIMQIFVSLMGVLFIFTMIVVRPNIPEIFKGLFIPRVPENGFVTTLALIGTTLIGINLILHSITSSEKWNKEEDLADARFDIWVNILIGGVITMSIIITSATVLAGTGVEVTSPLVFSSSLEPVLGNWARYVGDFGLAAAGLSSAIAIPFTLKSIFAKLFHWEGGAYSPQAKILGAVVVVFGTILAMTGYSPIQIILFAQATSGFFLPFIAIMLMIAANNKRLLGKHTNNLVQNFFGAIAVIVTLGLGFWNLFNTLIKIFG